MQAGGSNGGGGSQAASMYRTMRSRSTSAALGDINVTPLVDVVLVLLLVFMVTAPMMTRGIDLKLPVANQPQIQPEDRQLVVSIKASGIVYINDRPIAMPLLEDQLRGRLQNMATRIAYLRADRALQYGTVVEVIDIMKRAGVEQFGLAYELPPEKARK
jgi:biopolymer transport protein TolR